MEQNSLGFMVGKQLLTFIDEVKKTHIVGAALYENMSYINSMGFIFFDLSPDGVITAKTDRHNASISIFKWAGMLLRETTYRASFSRTMSIWDYYCIKDSDVEKFGNQIKALCKRHNYTVNQMGGKDLRKAFTMHREETGRLGTSCMNNYPEYFDMLVNCPDVSALVWGDENNRQIARCLLWSVDIGMGEKVKFMDRFYTSRDYLDGVLIKYAQENGLWRKVSYHTHQHASYWVNPITGATERMKGSIDMACEGYKYYPYLDTFTYGNSDFISNSSYNCQYMYTDALGKREVTKSILK